MRVKCPNSDIILELPGDKMDMKFTCPACKKVHRVTVSITTPGEIAPTSKATQQIPKKYATGAYAPVVDIPIDADFVLFENMSSQQLGIDLGQAAESIVPPYIDRAMSDRHTEVRRDSSSRESQKTQPGEEKKSFVSSEPQSMMDESSTQIAADDGIDNSDPAQTENEENKNSAPPRSLWEDDTPSQNQSSSSNNYENAFSSASRPSRRPARHSGKKILAVVLLLLAALCGYLGWQQYLHFTSRVALGQHLQEAGRLSAVGDIPAAATKADAADEALTFSKDLNSPENLWNRLAQEVDFIPPIAHDDAILENTISNHFRQMETYNTFISDIDSGALEDIPAILSASLETAETTNDAGLALAMRKAVVARILEVAKSKQQPGVAPEETIQSIMRLSRDIYPLLDPASAATLDAGLAQASLDQADNFRQEVRRTLEEIDATAGRGDPEAVVRYRALGERIYNLPPTLASKLGDGVSLLNAIKEPEWHNLDQVAHLAELLDEAVKVARTTLSRNDPEVDAIPSLCARAESESQPNQKLAEGTVKLIEDTQLDAEKLMRQREDLFFKLQSESRRDKISPGTMSAWRILLTAFGNSEIAIDPDSVQYDAKRAETSMVVAGVPLHVKMNEKDHKATIRASVLGYSFQSNWSPFFNKPITWIATLASQLRAAGVDPIMYPSWEAMEGPGGLLALTLPGSISSSDANAVMPVKPARRMVFFQGKLLPVEELSAPMGISEHGERFRSAAHKLHEGIMGDESIPQAVRQALKPVLMGTYLPIDPLDYFDATFCRRLVEADYLETYIKPMPPERKKELEEYRTALDKLEAGYDEFKFSLDDDTLVSAVANMHQGAEEGQSGDQDAFSGEIIPRYTWRVQKTDETVYYSPLPSRFNYALSLAEHYPGLSATRPSGAPAVTEVWHATKGLLATYKHGTPRAEGDEQLWDEALASDVGGPLNPVYGPSGWNFPLHVLERNDQGDPMAIAILDGVVKSPDFSQIADTDARRRAEDEWLDTTAKVFSTPGELGLIFHQFFRYCSDSPLPERPNLIGSHFGLSDTHQTVYESLERRWVGRLIGDCDDLAEFFQVLSSRQNKLSYVMNLPSHAACGYVDKLGEDEFRFIVLQTGQVLQFNGKTLNQVVEDAYRYFDRSGGESHLTMDAVPILLRFADEETRTPFVLSARIYADKEYADAMIRVQAYWHENTLSAAIKEMQVMLKTDREIGSIKELGSLYERVGMYEQSAELRRQELELVKDDSQAKLSTLLELAQLYIQDRNKPEALNALKEMEEVMLEFTRKNDIAAFMRVLSFRSQWAILMSRLGEPARAWNLVKYDVDFTKRQQGFIAEPVLRTLIFMYDKMTLNKETKGSAFTKEDQRTLELVEKELESAFVRGVFQDDDDYTRTLIRYFFLGRYAISKVGRDAGLAKLEQDGPYPTGPKDQTKRGRDITDDDWAWMRISPPLYIAYGLEKLDQEEFPELYDPAGAKPLLENVTRSVEKGTGLGSDIIGGDDMVRADMTLSFINDDLAAFRKCMEVVKEKNYSKLYDDIAMSFGLNCGLIPLDQFDAWVDAFRDYFPGKQHYFKVVYRAIDKENYDHALKMAEKTAQFFPDEKLIVDEAAFVRKIVPELKQRKMTRPQLNLAPVVEARPAA